MPYPLESKYYGKLRWVKHFSGLADKNTGAKGGNIGVLENGTWLHHPSGHPLTLEEGVRILSEIAPDQVSVFKAWHERSEQEGIEAELAAPRPIRVCRDDILRFEDGDEEEVDSAAAIFAYFPPNSMALETALRMFQRRHDEVETATIQDLFRKDQGDQINLDTAFGRTRAGRERPATDPIDEDAVKERRRQNLEKARAVRAANLEAKKKSEEKLESLAEEGVLADG